MKKMFPVILCLALILSVFVPAKATDFSNSEPTLTEYQKRQFQANIEYSNLLNSFKEDYGDLYPEYYGGAYVNSDGDLVVRSCKMDPETIQDICKRTNNYNIFVEAAEYSYNTLRELKSEITNYVINNPHTTIAENLTSAAIMDDTGKIEIGMSDNSANRQTEMINEVFYPTTMSARTYYNSDFTELFTFTAENLDYSATANENNNADLQASTSSTTIYAGDKITTADGSGLSIGFPCRRKLSSGAYEYGFATAGHAGAVGETISYNGSIIGTITAQKYGGRMDCSFVKMTDQSYSLPQSVKLYDEDTGKTEIYPVAIGAGVTVAKGSKVYKDGYKTNTTEGTVQSVDADLYHNDSGVQMTNLIKTSPMSRPGDSGGLGFMFGTDPETLKTSAIKFGLVEGWTYVGSIATNSYFVNRDYIYTDMGISAYQRSAAPW